MEIGMEIEWKLGSGHGKYFNINKLSRVFGKKIALEALFWGQKTTFKENCKLVGWHSLLKVSVLHLKRCI